MGLKEAEEEALRSRLATMKSAGSMEVLLLERARREMLTVVGSRYVSGRRPRSHFELYVVLRNGKIPGKRTEARLSC